MVGWGGGVAGISDGCGTKRLGRSLLIAETIYVLGGGRPSPPGLPVNPWRVGVGWTPPPQPGNGFLREALEMFWTMLYDGPNLGTISPPGSRCTALPVPFTGLSSCTALPPWGPSS